MKSNNCKMQIANCKLQIVIACVFAFVAIHTTSAQPFSFNDIEFWVGSGPNRAALVIDWDEDSHDPPALAWGYRWDGVARGSDMLQAIVAADPRLFAKLGRSRSNPDIVFGLGYDANGDGQFAIDDGTVFDDAGIAYTADPTDGVVTADPDDFYAEGWLAGFWHYGVSSANPFDGGIWADSLLGMSSRTLADGAWDSWAFESPISFTAYAENPHPALPLSFSGDFNHDGRVDTTDYELWRSTYGSMSELAADASGNGTVDAADYVAWRDSLDAAQISIVVSDALITPEPATLLLTLTTFLIRMAVCRTLISTNSREWARDGLVTISVY
jgi:hypothetical protein